MIESSYEKKLLKLFQELIYSNLEKQNSLSFTEAISLLSFKTGVNDSKLLELGPLERWYKNIFDFEMIKDLSNEEEFEEIICHGPDSITKKKNGLSEVIHREAISNNDFLLSLQQMAIKNSVFWNYKSPFASFKTSLGDQDVRVSLVHPSISSNKKAKVFIRKQTKDTFPLENYTGKNHHLIKEIFKNKKNIIISGSTGSGKTSFIRALLKEYGEESEHNIILEDTQEIRPHFETWTQLISSESEGKSLTDFCSYALRMAPSRIILGEIRSKEVVPFLLSMNNGHKGLMTTIHANSAIDTLSRVSLLFSLYSEQSTSMDSKTINQLISRGIDYVIYLKDKQVLEVAKVISWHGQVPVVEII